MQIDELVPLTNGLSLNACGQTLVCDRARLAPVGQHALDLKFLIAGTDFVPRLRLTRDRITKATADEVMRIVRGVARRAVNCEPRR